MAWLSYSEAKNVVQQRDISNLNDWWLYSKTDKPNSIPAAPHLIYKDEFEGWSTFLGNSDFKQRVRGTNFVSYERARDYMDEHDIKTRGQFLTFCKSGKRPLFIPSNPNAFYKDEWISWMHFFKKKSKFVTYTAARSWMQTHRIINSKKFNALIKKKKLPSYIPTNPAGVYSEYKGKWHFLGFDEKWMSYEDFLSFVVSYSKSKTPITSIKTYTKWASTDARPINVCNRPDIVYNKTWAELMSDIN